MIPSFPKLPSINFEWPDLTLPHFEPTFSLGENFSLPNLESIALGRTSHLIDAQVFLRKLPKNLTRRNFHEAADLEKWLQLFRLKPAVLESQFKDQKAGLPFIAFLGIAALFHVALGWGIYHYLVEKPQEPKPEDDPNLLAMVELSQTTLREWRQDPAKKIDYWPLFLMSENVGKPQEEIKGLMEKLAAKAAVWKISSKSISDPGKKMKAMTRSMYLDYFQHYAGKFPMLSDFSEFGKGNCAAQAKLVLPPLMDEITPPPSEGFGVQTYKKHLAPVHYKKNEEGKIIEVRNLITGKVQHEVVAPIYRPISLIAAYVKAHGQEPAVSFDELLVEAPAPDKIQKVEHPLEDADAKSAGLAFPETDAEYPGDAPDDLFIPPPEWEEEVTATPSKAGDSSEDVPGKEMRWEDLSPGERQVAEDFGIAFAPHYHFVGQKGTVQIVFKYPEDSIHYQVMTSEEDQQQFLLSLLRIALQRKGKDPTLSKAIELYSKPGEASSKLSEPDLEKISDLAPFLPMFQEEVRKTSFLNGKVVIDDSDRAQWKEFLQSLPDWKKLDDAR